MIYQASLAQKALAENDSMGFINASQSAALEQYRTLRSIFEESGIPVSASHQEVMKFREWPANRQLPTHRIFAYLMAALGWNISCGQRSGVEGGIFNDFNAIATYGPYVDAMFIDKECAQLLTHGRLRSDLNLKARIFSLQSRDDFLQYLTDLGDSASNEICIHAADIYGVS